MMGFDFVDDRDDDTDRTFADFGIDLDDPDGESIFDLAEASEFGVDDRPDEGVGVMGDTVNEGDQLALFPDVEADQRTLGGGEAASQSLFDDSGSTGRQTKPAPKGPKTIEERMMERAERMDVSIAPEEAFGGVGVVPDRDDWVPNGGPPGSEGPSFASVTPDADEEAIGEIVGGGGVEPANVDLDIERQVAEADRAGVLDPEPGPAPAELGANLRSHAGGRSRAGRTKIIEFGSRETARQVRAELPDAAQSGKFDGRHKSIEVRPENIDREKLRELETRAEAEKFEGFSAEQLELTEVENRKLRKKSDFDGRMVLKARQVKGLMSKRGVDDWISHFDPTLSVAEHREIAERARRDDRGQRMDEDDTVAADRKQAAEMHAATQRAQCGPQVQEGCEEGYDEACQILKNWCGWSEDEIQDLRGRVERGELTEAEVRRMAAVEFKRQKPNGRFVPAPTQRDPRVPANRHPRRGRFVSPSLENPGVKRDTVTGRFESAGSDG